MQTQTTIFTNTCETGFRLTLRKCSNRPRCCSCEIAVRTIINLLSANNYFDVYGVVLLLANIGTNMAFHQLLARKENESVFLNILQRARGLWSLKIQFERKEQKKRWQTAEQVFLGLLQIWADKFLMHQDEFPAYHSVYRQLCLEKVKFPSRDLNMEITMGFICKDTPIKEYDKKKPDQKIQQPVYQQTNQEQDMNAIIVAHSQCLIHVVHCLPNRQMVRFQQVDRLLYRRLTQWIKTVLIFPPIRLSERVKSQCFNMTPVLQFPTEEFIRQCMGVLPAIVEIFNNGLSFNFKLSNGIVSQGRDSRYGINSSVKMPHDFKIKKVEIYHYHFIRGFKFFSNKLRILQIGNTHPSLAVTIVLLEENEQIIGVQYRFYEHNLSNTDFQFRIARTE